jgi:hexosaminidase
LYLSTLEIKNHLTIDNFFIIFILCNYTLPMRTKLKQNIMRLLIILLIVLSFSTSFANYGIKLAEMPIIPKPFSVVSGKGSFKLSDKSEICLSTSNIEVNKIGAFLREKLRPATGFMLPVVESADQNGKNNIYLVLSQTNSVLGDEGYQLTIGASRIEILANKSAGLFNGVQTLRQLFSEKIESSTHQNDSWIIPAGVIRDFPEYSYRGFMLDVARHFFSVSDVKRYIDLASMYKMNVFHIHLSDDQGWRIEIKKWPELTATGGKSQVGGGTGGFYTQEQYRDIVKYAAARNVMVVPEIDLPGHTNAMLASYAHLNCDTKAKTLYTGTEVGFSAICTSKESTYTFIEDVFKEISEMTPGNYIHIGGDESHVTKLEDYIPFVNRMQGIVAKLGKHVIGWDEIALSDLKANSFVQYWGKAENAVLGVQKGAKVIMSPAMYAYLDMKYDSLTPFGLNWAGYLDVQKSYDWIPESIVPGIKRENILGVEAPIWTESISSMKNIEYMAFPRIVGIAEVGWCSASTRNWKEYKLRLAKQGKRLKVLGVNYYPSTQIAW